MCNLLVNAEEQVKMIEKIKETINLEACPDENYLAKMLLHSPEQPNLSPFTLTEFLIDTAITQQQTPNARWPDIAFDGTNFMAVWRQYTVSYQGLYGVRISSEGSIIGVPFCISTIAPNDQPDIIFDGTNYFVVWTGNYNCVYGARIKPDGTVIDTNGFLIASNSSIAYTPAVDYGVGRYLIVWEVNTGNWDAYAALVDTNGTVLLNFPLENDPGLVGAWPDVSFNDKDTMFLTVWYGTYVFGSRILPDGTNLDPGGFRISNQAYVLHPRVDFDGTNWFVVWSWLLNDFSGAWVSPDGIPFGEFNDIPGSWNMWVPALVVGDSVHWLQAFNGGGTNPPCDIYITRIDFSGNVIDTPWIPVDTSPGWQAWGRNTYGDSTFIAIWEDQRTWDIYARRYAPDGNPKDSTRFPVNLFTNNQNYPGVAFDGTNFLVVYEDTRTGSGDIYGARITQDGIIIDPVGFLICQNVGSQYWPRVAFGDSLYLVVWISGSAVYGARVLPDGTILDPNGFQITPTNSSMPSVSYNNGVFLVVYNHDYSSGAFGIWATRVSPNGTVLDPSGVEIEPFPGNNQQLWWPEIAPHKDGFFVTWNYSAYPGDSSRIDGAIVQADTGSINPGPTIRISTPGLGYDPENRWHGIAGTPENTFLVVWGKNYNQIYGTLLDSSGTVLSQIPICTVQPNIVEQPSVVFNGKDFVVVWQDSRQTAWQYDLYGARVSPNGVVLDTNGIEFVNSEYSRFYVELASATQDPDTGAKVLLVFNGYVSEPYNGNRALGAIYHPPTGIKEGYIQKIPTEQRITISPNISYQKPYVLSYSFLRQAKISVNIYDITGRLVKNVLNDKIKGTGEIKLTLEGMPQGIYFVRVKTENKIKTMKIIWLK